MKQKAINLKDETLYGPINFGQITRMYTLDQSDGGSMLFLETVFDTTLAIGFDCISKHEMKLEQCVEKYLNQDNWADDIEESFVIA